MCSGALNHLAKTRSLSFFFFCVRLLTLVGPVLAYKVNVEQVSKLITLSHDVRLGCLVMGLPFGFLFKMGEIQSHSTLGNERDPRQDSETCRYFSLLEERLVDYACSKHCSLCNGLLMVVINFKFLLLCGYFCQKIKVIISNSVTSR